MAFSFDLAVTLHRETRRMMRRSKVIRRRQRDINICKSHEPPQGMPFDLVIEILTRLPVDQNLTTPAMEGYSVSHVFHGLMCFTNGTHAQILPDIEESNIIADEDVIFKKSKYSIGHDPVHDQYKVVCVVSTRKDRMFLPEYWVFILGGGVSSRWRKISSPCPQHCRFTKGLTINGRMYYLALVPSIKPVFVRFDISSEETRLLQAPEDVTWPYQCFQTAVIEYDGRIAVLGHADFFEDGVMKLWVMEDEEKNMWSRKTLVLHPSQMNMVLNNNANSPYYLKVHDTTRNGEVILAPHNKFRRVIHGPIHVLPQGTTLFYVLLYNIQKNHLRRVEIEEGSNCFLNKRWAVIGLATLRT
uniref:F-box associated beta-propeller type 3 domain-containing protein n=1 Tax=Brassica oleracea var. oleracea TaxID=109376 RepID=A0A0D3DF25_BRAOL